MAPNPKKLFIGGYTKSGTTFIGRAVGLLNGVYAKGELDYFRLFFGSLGKLAYGYNQNIEVVNREVYDGRGELEPLTNESVRSLHDKIFAHIFFAGQDIPDDCKVIAEKSPRNIDWVRSIKAAFPDALNMCVYRDPKPVFRSMLRHMADHRSSDYFDPQTHNRRALLANFCEYWPPYLQQIEDRRRNLIMVRYHTAADDNAAFLDFAESLLFKEKVGLKAPVETLSKEHYLQSLPEEARAKSLVQLDNGKITLTAEEEKKIDSLCHAPNVSFDF
jgi:hypothetical protein